MKTYGIPAPRCPADRCSAGMGIAADAAHPRNGMTDDTPHLHASTRAQDGPLVAAFLADPQGSSLPEAGPV